MTLAARCPACGTVFRVVQDQLRVSEGWVRCGRCAEVFNAIETLVEVEADLPPRAATSGPSVQRVLSDLERVATGTDVASAERRSEPAPENEAPASPAPEAAPPTTADFIASQVPCAPQAPGAKGLATAPAETPDFVRRAERAARWRRPGVRAALAVAAVAGVATLAAQAALEYRDLLAAHWPGLRPGLESACALLDCRVEPLRAIESLAVDSSGLVRIEGTSMYRLSVVLRNRSSVAVAAPAFDLTLTDSRGEVISRRVAQMVDFGPALTRVPAAANLPLQTVLGGSERPISGYTIEIFYP